MARPIEQEHNCQQQFEYYLQQTKAHIADIRGYNDKFVDIISASETLPSNADTDRGVVLVHGLLDTCVSMMSLSDHFAQQGFHVKNILLPGHGTSPDDLIGVSWQDWYETIALAVNSFPNNIKQIVVVGLSAGGCLATYAGLHVDRVSQIIAFAPAYGLHRLAQWGVPITHRWNQLSPTRFHRIWLTRKQETSPFRYFSIATNGVHQLMVVAAKLRNQLKNGNLQKPILIVSSHDDETVSAKTINKVFASIDNPDSRHIVYTNQTQNVTSDRRVQYRKGTSQPNIISISHTAMHVFPSHPYYGEKDYETHTIYGASTCWNQCRYGSQFRRLTFNPDHRWLVEQMDDFLSDKK